MLGRSARGRRQLGGVVTTASRGDTLPPRPRTIAAAATAAAALSLAVVIILGCPSPTSGGNAQRTRTDLAMMTSSDATWWTVDERHDDTQPSSAILRRPRHLRHRHHHHRHRQENRQTSPPISGFDLFHLHSSRPRFDNSTSGRRRLRHVDDKSTSGDASVYKVVVDNPPSDSIDTILLEAETEEDRSDYFRFCDHRLVSSAVDRMRCRGSSDDVMRRCLDELVEIDREAEVKFQRFRDVMALFDCGHTYSVTSHCDDCKVRGVHCR